MTPTLKNEFYNCHAKGTFACYLRRVHFSGSGLPDASARSTPLNLGGGGYPHNEEKLKVLRMDFSIVENLSGLCGCMFSLFRRPQLNSCKNMKMLKKHIFWQKSCCDIFQTIVDMDQIFFGGRNISHRLTLNQFSDV